MNDSVCKAERGGAAAAALAYDNVAGGTSDKLFVER